MSTLQKYENQVVLELNRPNRNGRIYSTDTVEKAIADLNNRPLLCTFGMPTSWNVSLDTMAGLVSNLHVEGEQLLCNIIPSGPLGTILNEVSDTIAFRTAGMGQIDEHGNVTDYQFISISVVNKHTAA